jgi:hypothetical protein
MMKNRSNTRARFGSGTRYAGIVGFSVAAIVVCGSISVGDPALAAELDFRATVVKDTTLTHESNFVLLRLVNNSDERFQVRPLLPHPEFLGITITNTETRDTIPWHKTDPLNSNDSSDASFLEPDATMRRAIDLMRISLLRDEKPFLRYLPPGHYIVEFRFVYDWQGRELFQDSPVVIDSVEFTVVKESGVDSLALAAYQSALLLAWTENRSARHDGLCRVVEVFPESHYAGRALHDLAFTIDKEKRYPEGMDRREYTARLAPTNPESGFSTSYLRDEIRSMTSSEIRTYLLSILQQIPGSSHVGKWITEHVPPAEQDSVKP